MSVNFYKQFIIKIYYNKINDVGKSFNFYILQTNLNFIVLLSNLLVKSICDVQKKIAMKNF